MQLTLSEVLDSVELTLGSREVQAASSAKAAISQRLIPLSALTVDEVSYQSLLRLITEFQCPEMVVINGRIWLSAVDGVTGQRDR